MLLLEAIGLLLAFTKRPQLLDLSPQADELLAIHARLLELAQDLLIGVMHLLPAHAPCGPDLVDAPIGEG